MAQSTYEVILGIMSYLLDLLTKVDLLTSPSQITGLLRDPIGESKIRKMSQSYKIFHNSLQMV